jgi:hypothetical protein
MTGDHELIGVTGVVAETAGKDDGVRRHWILLYIGTGITEKKTPRFL